MNTYGVTISVEDLYYEIEAPNQEEAMGEAFHLAYLELSSSSTSVLDCNECILLEGEEPNEDEDE